MTIKSKFAAIALSLMIASPAMAQTGAAVTTNAGIAPVGIAPVQAQVGADAKLDNKTDTIKSESGMQAQPVIASEHKDDVKLGKDGKELPKDARLKSETAIVK